MHLKTETIKAISFSSSSFPHQSPGDKMTVAASTSSLYLTFPLSSTRVRASFDSQQGLSYNTNGPRKVKKPLDLSTNSNGGTSSAKPPTIPKVTSTSTGQSAFYLHKHPSQGVVADFDESYMGYDRWMPTPAKVEKPRSVFNAAALAYIGDCIYELYARRHFLFPPLSIEDYNDRVMAVVRCETQDALLQKLINEKYLSSEERDVLRWGKNVGSANSRTKRRAGAAVYNRASSLETLVGYLYLTNANRLEEVMSKLGFTNGASMQMILEEAGSK